jgi:hypothetical protein
MSNIETATRMVSAMLGGDIETMLGTLTDDIAMTTPMGPQKGKPAVGATLKMFVGMGAKPGLPEEVGGEIYSKAMSPMGAVQIVYQFRDGLICNIATRPG